ncbi:hypothetical protein OTU49_001918, partial [Cherax quadricarinatus]
TVKILLGRTIPWVIRWSDWTLSQMIQSLIPGIRDLTAMIFMVIILDDLGVVQPMLTLINILITSIMNKYNNIYDGGNGSNIQNSLFLGNSQPHHMTMFKQTSGSFVHNQSARGNHTGVNMVQPVSHPLHREHTDIPRERPRDLPHLEGIYASGYRPASHYTGSHYKPPPPPPHHHTTKLTVPGSKV